MRSAPASSTPTGGLREAVRRHPVAAFSVLVLALSWPMLRLGIEFPALNWVLWVLSPASCAVVITGIADGRAGVRELVGRVLRWRVPVRWYLFVLFGMAAGYWVAGYALTALLTPAELAPPHAGALAVLMVNLVVLFVAVGLVEEIGWRGFALPRLQRHLTPLRATLIVGLLWWAWHLPLLLLPLPDSPNPPADRLLTFGLFFVCVLADAVIYTWVFNRTGGSVLLVALMHATGNAWGGHLYTFTFTADPPGFTAFYAARVGVYVVVAIALIVLTRGRLGSDLHHIDGQESGDFGVTVPPHGTR